MMKKWRSSSDYSWDDIDVEAVIRKEILIKQGAAFPIHNTVRRGELISSLAAEQYHRIFLACFEASDSSIQNSTAIRLIPPSHQTGLAIAHSRVVAQMRCAPAPKSPFIEEPVSERAFVYPKGKIIDIRKGHPLKKRSS